MSSIKNKLDPEFIAMLETRGIARELMPICAHTLLKAARLKGMVRALDEAAHAEGITAEIGCASGGTSRLIASLNKNRKHWAVDTFVGLVDAGQHDPQLVQGDFKGPTLEVVSERLRDLSNVTVVKGFFPNCAPAEMLDETYSLVHIDTDTYNSMKNCFEFFEKRMAKGGMIVLDDVIGKGTYGAKKWWAEVYSTRGTGCGWKLFEQNDPHVIIKFTA